MDSFIILNVIQIPNNIWHVRLDHIGQQYINMLAKEGLLGNINKLELSTCEYYLAQKITKQKIFGKGTKVKAQL